MAKSEFMYVKSGNAGRVGMAEVDPAHPGGSVLVTNRCAKVGKTSFAMFQLRNGDLVECDSMKANEKKWADDQATQRIKDNPRDEDVVVEDDEEDAPSGPTGSSGPSGATGAS